MIHAGELARLAYFNDIVVGGVCCRVDVASNDQNNANPNKRMYIMTLGTLAPYRRSVIAVWWGHLSCEHTRAALSMPAF